MLYWIINKGENINYYRGSNSAVGPDDFFAKNATDTILCGNIELHLLPRGIGKMNDAVCGFGRIRHASRDITYIIWRHPAYYWNTHSRDGAPSTKRDLHFTNTLVAVVPIFIRRIAREAALSSSICTPILRDRYLHKPIYLRPISFRSDLSYHLKRMIEICLL